MNIWHIIPTTNPGGIEVFAKSLIKDFPTKANHIIFSIGNVDGIMVEEFKKIADLRKLSNNRNFKSIFRTIRLFKNQKPDAIIIHTLNSSLLNFILIAKIFRVSKVIILVGNPPFKEFLFKLKIFIFFLRLFKVPLVCCSKFVFDEFKKNFKLPQKSKYIRYGCNLLKSEFAIKNFKEKLIKNKKLIITMVARLDDIKDHETLIKAFLSIKSDKWLLQFVGGGRKEVYLKNLVNSLNGNNSIKFLGSRNDVLNILANTEIFAFSTTVKEGFGIVLIEALSMGIPIIASDVPACREVLIDGKGGILVPESNIKNWEKNLNSLMESESKRYLLANKAKRISKYYDIKLVAKEYINLLNGI